MGNNRRFGIKHIWAESGRKRVVLRRSSSDRSQSVYEHRFDIKESFCRNGVTNESLWRVDQLQNRISRFQECVIFRVLRPSACLKWRFTSNFALHAQCGKVMTHRAVTYFSQLPARIVIMSVGETTAGLGSKLYMARTVFKRVVLRRSSSDRSQSVYEHRLDIKESFCRNGVTNESLRIVDQLVDRISRFQECVIFRVLRPSACSKWRFTSIFAAYAECGKIQWFIEQ